MPDSSPSWADELFAPPKPAVSKAPPTRSTPKSGAWADELFSPPAQAAATPGKAPQSGNVLTRSVLTYGGGKGLSERFGSNEFMQHLDSMVPEDIKKSHGGDYAVRFAEEVYRQAPEALDFITSPAGIGIMAMHFIPQAKTVAGVIDAGLALYQGKQALDAVKGFAKDQSPESAARMAVGLASAYGMAKAAKAKLAGEPGLPTAIRDSSAVRESIISEGSQAEKVEALDAAAQSVPGGFWKKQLAKAYRKPVARDVAAWLSIPKNDLLQVGSDLVRDRVTQVSKYKWELNQQVAAIEHSVPAAELKIYDTNPDGTLAPANKIAAVLQGTKTAKDVGLSPEGQQAVKVFQDRNKFRDDLFRQHYGADNISLKEADTYLSQIWEFGNEKSSAGRAARTVMRDRFLKGQRVIDDYETGIRLGLKPKYNNILDILKVREDHAINTIANQRMANVLKDMGALITEEDHDKLNLGWKPQKDAPALFRATYSGTDVMKGKTYRGEPSTKVTTYMRYKPVYVHPDIEMAVKAIFDKPWESPGFAKLDQLRAFGKKMALSLSFFHHGALSEQSHAIYATRNPLKAPLQTWFVNREFGRGVKTGLYDVFGRQSKDGGTAIAGYDLLKIPDDAPPVLRMKPEAIKPWLDAGLNLNSEDAEAALIKSWRNTGRDLPKAWQRAATAPVRAMGHLGYVMDRSLWDYYHQGQMINSSETIFTSEMNKLGPDATPEQIHNLRRAISDHVGSVYGAINYDQLLMSPKTRQAMNFLLLAPAWTLSNLRTITQGFEGETQARLAGRYMTGAAASWFLTTQLFNYGMTKWYGNPDKNGKKEPHFSWDNPGVPFKPGGADTGLTHNSINVAAGYNPNGSERYIVLGKGFREPIQWLTSPIETFKSKMSLPVRAAMTIFTGTEPSGYQVFKPEDPELEKWIKRADIAAEAFVPFSTSETVAAIEHKAFPEIFPVPTSAGQFLGFPTKSGLSYSKAISAYTSAMDDKDGQAASVILWVAQLEKLRVSTIVSAYRKKESQRRRNAAGPPQTFDTHGNPKGR